MKTITSIITFLTCCILIISCRKHDSSNGSIVGKWEADSLVFSITYPGYPSFQQDSIFHHGHSTVQIFNADSSLIIIDNSIAPADTTTGNYYLANDSIYIREAGDVSYNAEGKYAITNNQLTVSESADSLGASIVVKGYFTRQ
jgi:hypothetical protein